MGILTVTFAFINKRPFTASAPTQRQRNEAAIGVLSTSLSNESANNSNLVIAQAMTQKAMALQNLPIVEVPRGLKLDQLINDMFDYPRTTTTNGTINIFYTDNDEDKGSLNS